ncbi:MAG: radical SAM protein [Planctomycetota bacterium]
MRSEVEKHDSMEVVHPIGASGNGIQPVTAPSATHLSKSTKIRICEIYESLQGEGLLAGTSSVFVRTSGCNLRCWFCDTPFASWAPEGESLSIAEIENRCEQYLAEHYVLTGGEPMIFASLVELTKQLRAAGKHITIETAGTVYQPVHCDLISISPKLANSTPTSEQASDSLRRAHERRRENFQVIQSLLDEFPYQLKFVVDSPEDKAEVLTYLERLQKYCGKELDRKRLLIMPQGTNAQELEQRAKWLIPWCEQQGLQFCPRNHITWYGNKRGT